VIAFVSKLNIDIYFFILVETPRTMPSPQIQLICHDYSFITQPLFSR